MAGGAASVELDRVQVSVPRQFRRVVADYAEAKISSLFRYAGEPVLHARVRLTVHADPAVPRPVVAEANLDVNGRPVRAQVGARGAREAVDALYDVLRTRLQRMARNGRVRRDGGRSTAPGGRYGGVPVHRPDYFPRPVGEREVVRRKEVGLAPCTVDDAAAMMNALDYDFHLFVECGSGQDSVLYRVGRGLRLAQAEPAPERVTADAVPFTLSAAPADRPGLPDAVRHLDLSKRRFLFFVDPTLGRGCLLYRRYDGHYGLIVPAAEGGGPS